MSPGRVIRAIALAAILCRPALAGEAATPIGEWDGTYACLQGETALHLDITKAAGGSLAAVFRFSSVPSNASVPAGSFEMTGAFDPSTDHLTLSPGGWLAHPPGFVTVGLDGKLACSGSHLVGKVVGGTFCKSFDLVRDGSKAVPCGPALVASR